MKNKMALFVAVSLLSSVVASTVLTPNTNNQSGVIPSGYADLQFNLANSNWVKNLTLPKSANHNDRIVINSQAQYASYLDTSNTNLPVESLTINQGQTYAFVYNSNIKQWTLQTTAIYPINGQSNFLVPTTTQPIQVVQLRNGQWAQQVTLPSSASDGALLNVQSSAAYNSKINTQNLLFASSFIVKKGDDFWFKYSKALNKWLPEQISPYLLNVKNIGSKLNSVQAPLTEILFADANWVSNFQLPATANDRDRIVIKSNATWEATISNQSVDTQATLKLNKGDRYEFMFVSDLAKWVVISTPKKTLNAKDLSSQKIPDMKHPSVLIKIGNANWQPTLSLPTKAQVDDRVILSSTADWALNIQSANGLKDQINKGERQRYVYTANGWAKDSYTIDMLLVNSPEVSTALGANAAKIRMIESSDMTNEGAENSNAQFYIRNVGYLEYRIANSKTLGDITGAGRDDKMIQNERNRVQADAVYYQGNEEGCGLAWVNKTPSAYNMLGTGSTNCGIGVMRHEFGHNMGLSHNDGTDSARGFAHPLGSTIMGGNSLPYFSSPSLYHPKYGYRLGEQGKTDAVAMINKNAPAVSKFK